MKKNSLLLLLSILLLPFNLQASTKLDSSILDSIKAILPNIENNQKIKTQGCSFQKQKWLTALLTQESFTETLKFKKDCDLEGQYTVKVNDFFPINLKIQKHKHIKRIITNLKLEIIFTESAQLQIKMKDAILKSNKDISFDMTYKIEIDPMAASPLGKHKGGRVFLKRVGTKKINKSFPINLKTM
jgi:hypothetical protein